MYKEKAGRRWGGILMAVLGRSRHEDTQAGLRNGDVGLEQQKALGANGQPWKLDRNGCNEQGGDRSHETCQRVRGWIGHMGQLACARTVARA